jgi:hypothetical protein
MVDALILLGLVVAAVGVAVLIHVTAARIERRRAEAMKAEADGFGFEFHSAPDPGLLADVRTIHLFRLGRKPRIRNMMWGTTRDLGVAVFDFAYTVGAGKSQRTLSQTVIRFLAAAAVLPAFAMRPKTFWHKVGRLFGATDIDFETHPRFSGQYLLTGKDEPAVRGLFGDAVLEYFEENPGWCVEAAGPRVVVYRAGFRVEPDAVRSFLETGFEILALFRPTATSSGPPG